MAGKLMELVMRLTCKLTVYERAVLLALAHRARIDTGTCWPSVARIARDTGMEGRQVRRALKVLKKLGLVTITGHKPSGVNIYCLTFPRQGVTNSQGEGVTDSPTEQGNKEEQGKVNKKFLKTSTGKSTVLPGGESFLEKPHDVDEKSEVKKKEKGDSKLVLCWKNAHAAAGLPVPDMSGIEGAQLAQVGNGDGPSYAFVRDKLIPVIVKQWSGFCVFCHQHWVHFKGKTPMPEAPDVGFLLCYRKLAVEFVKNPPPPVKHEAKKNSVMVEVSDEELMKVLSKSPEEIKKHLAEQNEQYLKDLHLSHEPEFGPLPKDVPKPKGWHSPKWAGHPVGSTKSS